eukprot:11186989-Prorocentrum_lima.AAC.1
MPSNQLYSHSVVVTIPKPPTLSVAACPLKLLALVEFWKPLHVSHPVVSYMASSYTSSYGPVLH